MTATTFEQVMLVVASVTGCVNTGLQVLRSVMRRKETRERRMEIVERRAMAQFLADHAAKEEAATKRIEEKHDELASEVRAMTPISNKPVVPKG